MSDPYLSKSALWHSPSWVLGTPLLGKAFQAGRLMVWTVKANVVQDGWTWLSKWYAALDGFWTHKVKLLSSDSETTVNGPNQGLKGPKPKCFGCRFVLRWFWSGSASVLVQGFSCRQPPADSFFCEQWKNKSPIFSCTQFSIYDCLRCSHIILCFFLDFRLELLDFCLYL